MDRDPARWAELRALLERLLDGTPAQRATLLADVRRGDPALASELSRLLRLEPRARHFMDPPGEPRAGERSSPWAGP
ncbi:MAG: hypothetical protein H6825_10165 [Planctomycetes bacterium]|nr:hypothetical protein [Planctomycetota bacterium]